MIHEKLFEQWQLSNALDNVLCDDDIQISYREAQERIELYRSWLLSRQFQLPLVYFCDQTVEHLLLLLALMSTDINFVQLPANVSELDCHSFGDWLKLESPFQANLTHIDWIERRRSQVESITDAVYFRTSGSLGDPKIVVHQRQQLIANSRHVLTRLPLNADCRVLIPVPIHHMYGFGAALWPSLLVGANIQLTTGLNILKFRAIERDFAPNVIFMTPPTIGALLLRSGEYRQYRFVVSAGDCFDIQTFQAAKAKFNRVFNLYGSTELGVIAVGEMALNDGQVDDRVKALHGVKVNVSNSQLAIAHPHGFDGYLGQDELTEYFDTGDLVQASGQDRFRVIGRSKLSINREGRLIAFSELETQIRQHESIQEVALVKGPKDCKGHTIIAIVETETKQDCDELRRQLAGFLPLFATPSKIIIESKLPRLCNGKINRKQIAQFYEEIEV